MEPTAHILLIILIGMLLGITGQGIRIIIGLKKRNETRKDGQPVEPFSWQRLMLSLLIALFTGIVAGVLAALNTNIEDWNPPDKALLFSLVAAGYSGTDFIEGFMRDHLPKPTT